MADDSSQFHLGPARYTADRRQPPHTHDELQITIVLRGGLEERVGSSAERAGALSVVVKDPGVLHADQFGRHGAVTAQLALPNTTLADLVEHAGPARAWRWMHDRRAALPLLRLVARGVRGERRFARDDDDIVDLLAAVSAQPVVPSRGEPRWLSRAVQRLRDEWRPGLAVRDVARDAGVHPVYLARCVRRWYRVSAADLLRHERLRHAAAGVADGEATIATVAYAAGFADESHLCREFARAAGMPPARYRRLTRAFAGFTDSSLAAAPQLRSAHEHSTSRRS